ncbi:hypothetical protein V6N11_079878 [Hibiscus sabdariffa]|uniref:RNase H type-1 domain-containing protein n=1 Tax=Hibiscus sabdariffa TaxID=183260 RepID=A0ABR2RX11_9ROSI
MQSVVSLERVKWQPPQSNVVKANFDVTFKSESGEATSSVVIRDSLGSFVGASFRRLGIVPSPSAAEASAAIHAIELTMGLGFTRIIVEGDSLSVIKKLKAKEIDLSDICALEWDAKSKAQTFHACSFSFVPRLGNQAAHHLAFAGFADK